MEELSKDPNQEKLQKILLMLIAIPEKVETALQKIQREICHTFTRESQVRDEIVRKEFQAFCKIDVIMNCGQTLNCVFDRFWLA